MRHGDRGLLLNRRLGEGSIVRFFLWQVKASFAANAINFHLSESVSEVALCRKPVSFFHSVMRSWTVDLFIQSSVESSAASRGCC